MLNDGSKLEADIILYGIGDVLNTEYYKGLKDSTDNSLVTSNLL